MRRQFDRSPHKWDKLCHSSNLVADDRRLGGLWDGGAQGLKPSMGAEWTPAVQKLTKYPDFFLPFCRWASRSHGLAFKTHRSGQQVLSCILLAVCVVFFFDHFLYICPSRILLGQYHQRSHANLPLIR